MLFRSCCSDVGPRKSKPSLVREVSNDCVGFGFSAWLRWKPQAGGGATHDRRSPMQLRTAVCQKLGGYIREQTLTKLQVWAKDDNLSRTVSVVVRIPCVAPRRGGASAPVRLAFRERVEFNSHRESLAREVGPLEGSCSKLCVLGVSGCSVISTCFR